MPDITTTRRPHPDAPAADLLTCCDDGVTDAADHARDQAERWTRIARAIGRRPSARGYRLAVSRAGVWTLRAQRAERIAARQLVSRPERVRLARWETEAIRYEAMETEAQRAGWDAFLALVAK